MSTHSARRSSPVDVAERLRRQTANLIPSGCAGSFDLFSLSVSTTPYFCGYFVGPPRHVGTSEDGTTDRKSECVAPSPTRQKRWLPPPPPPHYQSIFFACAGLLGSEEDGPRHKETNTALATKDRYNDQEIKTPKRCADAINKTGDKDTTEHQKCTRS